jgi:hypothetical protein
VVGYTIAVWARPHRFAAITAAALSALQSDEGENSLQRDPARIERHGPVDTQRSSLPPPDRRAQSDPSPGSRQIQPSPDDMYMHMHSIKIAF